MLDKLMRVGQLYDFYGALLTQKQREYLEMHYLHDLSLSEIGEETGVSRQAVHDILRRAEQILEHYESELKLLERHQKDLSDIKEALASLQKLPDSTRKLPEFKYAEAILNNLSAR